MTETPFLGQSNLCFLCFECKGPGGGQSGRDEATGGTKNARNPPSFWRHEMEASQQIRLAQAVRRS